MDYGCSTVETFVNSLLAEPTRAGIIKIFSKISQTFESKKNNRKFQVAAIVKRNLAASLHLSFSFSLLLFLFIFLQVYFQMASNMLQICLQKTAQ